MLSLDSVDHNLGRSRITNTFPRLPSGPLCVTTGNYQNLPMIMTIHYVAQIYFTSHNVIKKNR